MPQFTIQANYDELAQIKQEFQSESDLAEQLTQRISALMGQLENGGWMGSGAENFYAEMEELVLPGLRRLGAALSEAGQTVGQISNMIRQAEEEAASILSNGNGTPPLAQRKQMEDHEFQRLIREYASGRSIIALAENGPDIWLEGQLPRSLEALKQTDAGKDLLAEAHRAGITFELPDGTLIGPANGKVIPIRINPLEDAHGGYDDKHDTLTLSSHPDSFSYPGTAVTETLAHEMQHAVDDAKGLYVNDFDFKNPDEAALKQSIETYVEGALHTEARAFARGEAVLTNTPYVDDGVLDSDERYNVLMERMYFRQYEEFVNNRLSFAYTMQHTDELRQVRIRVDDKTGDLKVLLKVVETREKAAP